MVARYLAKCGSAGLAIRDWCGYPWLWQHQMDPTGNFYNYRTALRGAAHRSRTANSNREKVAPGASALLRRLCNIHIYTVSLQIVIPFFSLLIKDIYFLNEGCANRLPNGHVNFEVGLTPEPPLSSVRDCSFWTDRGMWFLLFSEICGAGSTGWRVHDMEAGGVSVWGGSRHLALPPHCSRLQWGRWELVGVCLMWEVCRRFILFGWMIFTFLGFFSIFFIGHQVCIWHPMRVRVQRTR